MSTKHTHGLTDAHVFALAEKYGAFEFGDAQGDKRIAFAADVIEARERIRDAAPDLLEALQFVLSAHGEQLDHAFQQAHEAIAKATGQKGGA